MCFHLPVANGVAQVNSQMEFHVLPRNFVCSAQTLPKGTFIAYKTNVPLERRNINGYIGLEGETCLWIVPPNGGVEKYQAATRTP